MAKFSQAGRAILTMIMIAGLTGCDMIDMVEKWISPPPPPPPASTATAPLTVGGTVSGLASPGLVLQLNGANDLAVNASGKFSFPKGLAKGNTYAVTVKAAPSSPIKQSCTVSQGSGSIAATAIQNVTVNCTTVNFAIGGTVSGLAGKGLVLQVNGANDLAITKNGKFIFPGVRLPDGSDYSVSIKATPAKLKCEIKAISAAFDTDTLNIAAVTCSKKGRRR